MRKIIVFNLLTLDGYFAGANGEISWHKVDAEFNDFAIKQLSEEVGAIMFGHTTYDLMAGYWPTEAVVKDDPIVAELMNSASKIVFSKTLNQAEWNNTILIKEITKSEIEKLKTQPGKDLFIFGSGQIVQEIAKLGLIDEYRLIINPVVLGTGKSLFKAPLNLQLMKSREFKNGNVLLFYKPKYE